LVGLWIGGSVVRTMFAPARLRVQEVNKIIIGEEVAEK